MNELLNLLLLLLLFLVDNDRMRRHEQNVMKDKIIKELTGIGIDKNE